MPKRLTRNSCGERNFCPQDIGIGVNLRVTMHEDWGSRIYMEDRLAFSHMPTTDGSDTCLAYFGVFDGHGGYEAAEYAQKNLKDLIMKQQGFWSSKDEDVLEAIRGGFIAAHNGMRCEMDTWHKGKFRYNISTAGTTASIVFIMRGKMYIGHVGDSRIISGHEDTNLTEQFGPMVWKAQSLTKDHKPNSPSEMERIEKTGGKVKFKKGVARVVWKRKKLTLVDDGDSSDDADDEIQVGEEFEEVPFLSVARSLGDFWSLDNTTGAYTVSPYPDISVSTIDLSSHRCLLLASDGVWNLLDSQQTINSVAFATKLYRESANVESSEVIDIVKNPSLRIVKRVKDLSQQRNLKVDNISVLTVIIEPPGPATANEESAQLVIIPSTSPQKDSSAFVDKNKTYLITSKAAPTTSPVSLLRKKIKLSKSFKVNE